MSSPTGLARWYVNMDDYVLGGDLGSGAFGTVKLGIRRSDGLKVAIKQLQPFETEIQQKNFVREITIPARLQDPAIVPLIGFCFQDGMGNTIVTKFIPNGSLDAINELRVLGRPLPPNFTPINLAIIFYGIAHALGVLHKNSIFHRDLKPGNVLLGDDYEPYLADFGLSRADSDLTLTASVGSPMFMAPEIWDGRGEYDAKVDIFAFAVTMYFSLTADHSFVLDDGKVVSNAVVLGGKIQRGLRLARKPDINDAYWRLITWCWGNEREKRPSAEQVCAELEKPVYLFESEKGARFREYVQKLKDTGKQQVETGNKPKSQPFRFTRK